MNVLGNEIPDEIGGAALTALGGIGAWVGRGWTSRQKAKVVASGAQVDLQEAYLAATQALAEGYRQDIASLRSRVTLVESEVQEWRSRYFALQNDHEALKRQMSALSEELHRVRAEREQWEAAHKAGRSGRRETDAKVIET